MCPVSRTACFNGGVESGITSKLFDRLGVAKERMYIGATWFPLTLFVG